VREWYTAADASRKERGSSLLKEGGGGSNGVRYRVRVGCRWVSFNELHCVI
jgi:hypothetical protein